jgi:hypothetical protein
MYKPVSDRNDLTGMFEWKSRKQFIEFIDGFTNNCQLPFYRTLCF